MALWLVRGLGRFDASVRDGERVLVVPRDEVAIAEQLLDADRVTGYGERGFGLELNPVPLLLGAVSGLAMVSSARRAAAAGKPVAGFTPPAGETPSRRTPRCTS